MKVKHPNRWLVGGAVGLMAVAVAGGVAFASAGVGSSSAGAANAVTTSGSDYTQASLVQQLATAGGVTGLEVLVSAGPGSVGSNSSAVIVGTDTAGQRCWTAVGSGGGVGGPFRCGTQPGEEPGATAVQQLRVGCQTSGSVGSATASSVSCIGFVGSNVSAVNATLSDGSTQQMTLTDGAFAYAASSADKLPTTFTASDASGQTVSQRAVSLSK